MSAIVGTGVLGRSSIVLLPGALAMEAAGCHSIVRFRTGRAGGLNGEPKEMLHTYRRPRKVVVASSRSPDNRS